MMKALLTEEGGGLVLVFGLSHKNVEELKQNRPILTPLHELNIPTSAVISAVQPDGSFSMPKEIEDGMLVLMYVAAGLDHMVQTDSVGLTEVDETHFKGKVLTFSAKDEHTMAEMFREKFQVGKWVGTTCPVCRSAHREDATCDCPQTVH